MSNYNIKLQSNNTTLQRLIDNVNSLPDKGTDLPELTNPGTDSELFLGKELIDSDGNVVTGNFTIDNELSSQSNLLSQIETMLENKSIGSGINFSIKAYFTEEALLTDTPAENTIGVITENEITKYYFSATEPEDMLEGEVWFSIGTNSPVEFSLLKTIDAMVYPLFAKQYVSGAWVDVTAKSYQNGEWVDWVFEKYLFKSGEGALVSFSKGDSGACTITQTANSVKITTTSVAGGEGFWITSDKHDLSQATKVKIRAKCTPKSYTSDVGWNGKFLVTSKKPTDAGVIPSAVASVTLNENSAKTVYEIDVSSLTNSYYIGFWGQSNVEIYDLYYT